MFDDDDFESQLRHITILLEKNDSNTILHTHTLMLNVYAYDFFFFFWRRMFILFFLLIAGEKPIFC